MQDPKFEQEVQRRMHDLEFVPSESVWAGIRQGIAPRERRRAVAVLWWLFPGMMLITGGVMMYRHLASRSGIAVVTKVRDVRSGGVTVEGSSEQPAAASKAGGQAGLEEQGAGQASGNEGAEQTAGNRRTGQASVNGGIWQTAGNKVADNRSAAVQTTGQELPEDAENARGTSNVANSKRAGGSGFHPGLIRGMADRREITGPMLNVPVNTAVDGIRRPIHPWMVGFVAGGGGATVYSRGGNALAAGSSSGGGNGYNYSGNNAVSNPGLPQMRPAILSAGSAGSKRNGNNVGINYSYWAGIYGERQLSARWSVDLGLNLHYYSVRFQTETQINAYAPTAASLIVASPLSYAMNFAGAYGSTIEQTCINSYYFLEVPLTAQLRLNRSRTIPVFWRGGVVASYLVSSNGLYYDTPTGEYKRDNGVMRRAQAGVNTGLAVGLPVKGVQIQAGPEIQYALTSMLKSGSGGGNLLYGGLRIALIR